MFVDVDIPLGKGKADLLGIKPFLDDFRRIEIDPPIIGRTRPDAHGEIHAAVGKGADDDHRGRIRHDPVVSGDDFTEYRAGFVNIVIISDAEDHIDPPGSLGGIVDDIIVQQFRVGDDDEFIVRSGQLGGEYLYFGHGPGTAATLEMLGFK